MSRILAALLFLSLGFNAHLIWRLWGKEPDPVTEPVARVSGKPAPGSSSRAVYRFFPGPAAKPQALPPDRAEPPSDKDPRITPDDPLCQVALERLGRHADESLQGFLEFFGELRDPRKLEGSFEDNLAQVISAVGEDRVRASSLRKEYGEIFYKNAREFLDHTTTNPPNFRGMLELSRKHYREEDGLVQRLFGEARMYQYRASQLKRRVDLTATLAHYTKTPWNEALAGLDLAIDAAKPSPTAPASE